MANSKSALKRIRQTKTLTARNKVLKNRIKLFRKEILTALELKDSNKANEAYNKFSSAADKASKKGTIHKNTASRFKSRMSKKLNNIFK